MHSPPKSYGSPASSSSSQSYGSPSYYESMRRETSSPRNVETFWRYTLQRAHLFVVNLPNCSTVGLALDVDNLQAPTFKIVVETNLESSVRLASSALQIADPPSHEAYKLVIRMQWPSDVVRDKPRRKVDGYPGVCVYSFASSRDNHDNDIGRSVLY
jgi:hypothetical protein